MQHDPYMYFPPPEPPKDTFIAPRKSEIIIGVIYLVLHMFFLGDIIHFVIRLLGLTPSLIGINLVYMLTGTLVLTLTMRRYLLQSFAGFRTYGMKRNWAVFGIGYAIRLVGSIAIAPLITVLLPDFLQTPNSEVVMGMAANHLFLTAFLAIILAPILEELLFRGAIFGGLRKKNRILAYTVSTLAFAFLHVLGFLLHDPSPTLLFVMLLYIPAGLGLAWSYERSGSIWTAIFLHALMNLIAPGLGMFVL